MWKNNQFSIGNGSFYRTSMQWIFCPVISDRILEPTAFPGNSRYSYSHTRFRHFHCIRRTVGKTLYDTVVFEGTHRTNGKHSYIKHNAKICNFTLQISWYRVIYKLFKPWPWTRSVVFWGVQNSTYGEQVLQCYNFLTL